MNPFTAASCRLFYSRETVIRELLADEQQGQSNLLFAGRRCGKTRLLERLHQHLRDSSAGISPAEVWLQTVPDHGPDAPPEPRNPHWPVLISLQGQSFQRLGEVFAYIAQCIVESAPPVKEIASPPGEGCTARDLTAWILKLDSELNSGGLGGLALLVDEVEELLSPGLREEGGESVGDRLLTYFRFLDDSALKTRIWFVLAGSERLERYRHPGDGSPPLNTTRRARLPGLDYRGRRRMLIEPFVECGKLPPPIEAQRTIDRIAAGNIWILGRLLERLFMQPDWRPERIEMVAEEVLADQREVFERWTTALAPEDSEAWEIYRSVAAGGSIAASDVRGPRMIAARQLLKYHGLIHRPGPDVLELGPELFRRWAVYENLIRKPFGERPERPDGPTTPGCFRFDVALSWAAPQSGLVKRVAQDLRQLKYRVFYDRDLGHEMWGADLSLYLPQVFDREAELCVLLVSSAYVERVWPRLEARAALVKAIREGWNAVVVVSLDGARLPDYPDEVRRLEIDSEGSTAEIALEVIKRLGARES